jgi:hypothetical protein
LFGYPFRPGPEIKGYIDSLGGDYRLIFSPYPGESMADPKLYTLTAAAVVQDYLQIADAANAAEFAYIGYSWGATIGLQLAMRTDRLKALIVGGFPMINGPYEEIRQKIRTSIGASDQAGWGFSRQVLTYYESLTGFDDRKIQERLTIPRVNYVGSKDKLVFSGSAPINEIFRNNEELLRQFGWSTFTLVDQDHSTATKAEAAIPFIRPWLEKNWPAAIGTRIDPAIGQGEASFANKSQNSHEP